MDEKVLMLAMKVFGDWVSGGGDVNALPDDLKTNIGIAFIQRPELWSRAGTRSESSRVAARKPNKGGRRGMTPAQKKEVSDRMRRYWAARKAAKSRKK